MTFLLMQYLTNWICYALQLPFTSMEISLLCTVLTSTDTISVLSLIKPDTYPVLNAIVFGEGIVNDAVCILLFKIITQDSHQDTLEFVISFALIVVGSLAIGIAFAVGLTFFFKKNSLESCKETSKVRNQVW